MFQPIRSNRMKAKLRNFSDRLLLQELAVTRFTLKKNKKPADITVKSREKVGFSSVKKINLENKDKHSNHWQLDCNHRQRRQKVKISYKGLRPLTFVLQDWITAT